MTRTTVYRIEHRVTGRGPFSSGWDVSESVYNLISEAGNRIPEPWDDRLKDFPWELLPDYALFGFPSFEAMVEAFPLDVIAKLEEIGFLFREFELPEHAVKYGKSGKQVLFDIRHAISSR